MQQGNSDRKQGVVARFIAEKGFGFIMPDEKGKDIFFHISDYMPPDNSGAATDRAPEQGNRMIYKVSQTDKGPKASPWAYVQDTWKKVRVRHLPSLGRHMIQEGDLCVASFNGGYAPTFDEVRVSWVEVMLRPSTGELFQVLCHDNERGGFQTDLEQGSVPDGMVLVED